jgi:hypothetical protein
MVLFLYTTMKNQYNFQLRFGSQKKQTCARAAQINNEIEMNYFIFLNHKVYFFYIKNMCNTHIFIMLDINIVHMHSKNMYRTITVCILNKFL